MKLSQIAKLLHGKLQGADAEFQFVSTDTRTLQPGELFIPLKGPNFDGHDFMAMAEQKQAAAALISESVQSKIPLLQVEDTRIALGQLAAFHRQQFSMPVVGLTGSCGKTTTKAMIASILEQCGPTLAADRSFNNDIGVPLTVLRLEKDHQYAVIEMGANHPGEIAYVTNIAKPTVALITNAGPAHLEGFIDLPGVARAKGEIFQGLDAQGTAILNVDDQFSDFWRQLIGRHKIITFGLKNPNANVTAKNIKIDDEGFANFQLQTPQGTLAIKLAILGEHNVMNALAASAAALAVGAPLAAIKAGLETTSPVYKRLVIRKGFSGAVIIDDSYNANPSSVTAAIRILAQKSGEKILALGDMRELGPAAEQYHEQIGQTAKQLGINHLYAYGQLSAATVKAFGAHGQHFSNQAELINALRAQLRPNVTVLVKGSLSTNMGKVVTALVED